MKAPSGNVIPAHGLGQVTQTVLLNNPNKASPPCFSFVQLSFLLNLSALFMHKLDYTFISPHPLQVSLKMRIRVSYSNQGAMHQDTVQIDSFPSAACQPSISPLWQTYMCPESPWLSFLLRWRSMEIGSCLSTSLLWTKRCPSTDLIQQVFMKCYLGLNCLEQSVVSCAVITAQD